jgi:hypothetical protein
MVFNPVPAVETRQLGLGDNSLEVAVLGVVQDLCQVSAFPILIPTCIRPANPLKRRLVSVARFHHVVTHLLPPKRFHDVRSNDARFLAAP